MLCLQAEGAAKVVRFAAFPLDRAVEEVAGIELNARLGCRDVERTSGRWVYNVYHLAQGSHFSVQDEVVVVTIASLDLLIIRTDALTDSMWLPEIERRTLHRPDLTSRDQRCVNRRKAIGIDLNTMLQNVPAAFPGQVEVVVIGDVRNRVLVGGKRVVQPKLVVRCQRVADDRWSLSPGNPLRRPC